MATTPNLKLYVTPSSDTNTNVMDWVHKMAASDLDSNMVKLDNAYKTLYENLVVARAQMQEILNSHSLQLQTDKSLSLPGYAADAQVVGSQIASLENAMEALVGAGFAVDTTLTENGKAADAKVVGDKLNEVQALLTEINDALELILISTAEGVDLEPIATLVGGEA